MSDSIRFNRFQELYINIKTFLELTKLTDKVVIDKVKLRQAIYKYFNDTKQLKHCFNSGNTNESKQCVLTIKALNLYKPVCIKNFEVIQHKPMLNYINEVVALYCGFIYFKSQAFKNRFMSESDFIYILNNNSIDYEQLMITLNIFYKDYRTDGN